MSNIEIEILSPLLSGMSATTTIVRYRTEKGEIMKFRSDWTVFRVLKNIRESYQLVGGVILSDGLTTSNENVIGELQGPLLFVGGKIGK